MGSCGGFVRTYKCLSNFVGTPLCGDIIWDINNLYESTNYKEFNFSDFNPPSPAQARVIFETLKHNVWFNTLNLNLSNLKYEPEIVLAISGLLKENSVLSNLILSRVM